METVRFKQMTTEKKPAIYLSQGDTGKQIQIKTDIDPNEGISFRRIEGTKPSGGVYREDVMPSFNSTIIITITEQITNEPGITRAQLVFYGPRLGRIGSEQLQILVEPLGGVA